MYKLTLSSGNVFYYKPEDETNIALAITATPTNIFLGGFAGELAKSKFEAFKKFSVPQEQKFPNFGNFDITEYSLKLGAASNYFVKYGECLFNDYDNMNGTSSHAQTCDSREYYYRSAGLNMFKNNKNCPLWAFIANHLSKFSAEQFNYTFFKGAGENASKDADLTATMKGVKYEFKAPAAYIRCLCQYFANCAK